MSRGYLRVLAGLLLAAAVGALGFAAWLYVARPPPAPPATGGALVVAGEFGGPWSLVDHTGRRVGDADFRGRFLLVYFGYTYCPDICPTELAGMAAALDLLGPEGAAVTPLFVTVDPERDTPAKLAGYVGSFHPRLIGLTGAAEEIDGAARAFKVYRRKAGEGADYLVDHSGFVYLVGPDGRGRAVFRPGTAPAELARLIRPLLAG